LGKYREKQFGAVVNNNLKLEFFRRMKIPSTFVALVLLRIQQHSKKEIIYFVVHRKILHFPSTIFLKPVEIIDLVLWVLNEVILIEDTRYSKQPSDFLMKIIELLDFSKNKFSNDAKVRL
jgi:hypothetical protein